MGVHVRRDSSDMTERIRRPWLGALLFTTPLVVTAIVLFVMERLQGPLSESSGYPLWILAIFSLPWSVLVGGLFFLGYGLLFWDPHAPALSLFTISLSVGAFVGTWINGYICLRWWFK